MTSSHQLKQGVSRRMGSVFEYSIFGDTKGTTKIGDFTQSELERWSK